MADVVVLSGKAVEAIEALSERVSAKQWSDFSRTSFVFNTTQTINILEDLAVLFEEIDSEIEKEGSRDKVEVKNHLQSISSLMKVLQRNKDMEATRIRKAREKGIAFLAEDVIVPELYSSLEQKVLGMVLKSRYLLEQVNIHLRKKSANHFLGNKATKNVLDLLSEKENEMQKLKEKYEKIKNTSLIGRLSEATPSDLEHDLNAFSRKFHLNSKLLCDASALNKKKLIELDFSQKQLEERINFFDEFQSKYFEKTFELVTTLKKERDHAKKIVLEIEGETLSLRNAYSQKLLGLEQEKAAIKSEAFENFRNKLVKQENDLKEKSQLISSLQKILDFKEQKIKKINEQIKKN